MARDAYNARIKKTSHGKPDDVSHVKCWALFMLPSIALALAVELIRDGGSLAATFQGANGSVYWILFKVRLRELASGKVERIGYQPPVVTEEQVGTRVEISWEHSRVLLSQMRPLLRHEKERKWLEAMLTTAETKGQVPR